MSKLLPWNDMMKRFPGIPRAEAKLAEFAAPVLDSYIRPAAVWFTSDPWICYGVGPIVCVALGMILASLLLEWLVKQPFMEKYTIIYETKETRKMALKKTQSVVSWTDQMKGTLWSVVGPVNIFGCVLLRYYNEYLQGGLQKNPLPSGPTEWLVDFCLLMMIADLGLYIGHRLQHEVKFLWDRCHSYHHKLATPSAWSTAYIDDFDAVLQAALPLLIAQFVVRSHPVVHCSYLFYHLSVNALNHSGLHCWWLDILWLRWLPPFLRVDSRHHDSHHKRSKLCKTFGEAKNHGEFTWLWDYLGGTYYDAAKVTKKP